MNFFLRHLLAIAVVIAIAFLLDRYLSTRAAFWWLVCIGGLYAVFSAIHLARLHHWASLPRQRDLPSGLGPWRPVFERLGRFLRQESETRTDLLGELEHLHAAVDKLPDGLTVLDRYDHVIWSNDAAQELHGIFGARRPIHHFIRQPEFLELLASREENSRPIRLPLATRPGRSFEIRVHRSDNDQKIVLTRDVTDQAKLDAMRSDFVANVSHEIRTPVTVIGGFAETLLELDLTESERRQHLESILRQSQTMQRLVDDLLMLSSLERGVDERNEQPVDLHRLLETQVDDARALSAGRHTIELQIDGPRFVRGIPAELESAVRNLLTNAIRYTPDGGSIDVRWARRDDEGWITVRDTGIGIPPVFLPRIAERFFRVDSGRSRATGGTGLGLAIVKRIMVRHQGSLHIASEPDKGSAFSLRLPGARLLGDAASAPAASADRPNEAAAERTPR